MCEHLGESDCSRYKARGLSCRLPALTSSLSVGGYECASGSGRRGGNGARRPLVFVGETDARMKALRSGKKADALGGKGKTG